MCIRDRIRIVGPADPYRKATRHAVWRVGDDPGDWRQRGVNTEHEHLPPGEQNWPGDDDDEPDDVPPSQHDDHATIVGYVNSSMRLVKMNHMQMCAFYIRR